MSNEVFWQSCVIFHVGMSHTDECKSKPLLGSISFYSNFLFICISVVTCEAAEMN